MSIGMMNSEQCQTAGCSIDASNICKRERTIICHTWAAILHSNCQLKIKDEGGFIMNSVELLKDILKKINPEELVCTNNTNANYYIQKHKIKILLIFFETTEITKKIKRNMH